MDSRERVSCALAHREPDRVPIRDVYWPTTINRWRQEGLPADQSPDDYLDMDIVTFHLDCSLQLEEVIVEESDEYLVKWNANGALIKDWRNIAAVPQTLDYRITSRPDWEEYRSCLGMKDSRVDWEKAGGLYQGAREQGKFVMLNVGTGFGEAHRLMGLDKLLIAMADDPEWVDDIFGAFAQLTMDSVDEIRSRGLDFDAVFIRNDMAYKNGPMFSPRMYSELLLPHDREVCGFLRERRIPAILHCDGNLSKLLPQIIEAGFTCLHPLEVKAGMDLIQLKKEYGEVLAFMGGIDARKMGAPDLAEIEKEISDKISIGRQGGGYIFHSDHSVPDNVSLERYQQILRLASHYGAYGKV